MKKQAAMGLVILVILVAVLTWRNRYCESPKSNVIRVGAILPMTGNASNYGELMKRGISIAVDEYNAVAGNSAAPMEVVIEDSRSNPKDGVSAMQKLLQIDKVAAVMPALSGVVLACAPIAEQNHVVLLNCPANSPKLRAAGQFIFNLAILSDQESEFLADYAFHKMGAKSVGIFFVNNESGRGYRDSFATKFIALGGTVKLSEGHEQGATDFRTIIEKFRVADADVVFLTSYYSESALFLKQAKELGFKSKWLSYASIETPDFLKLAGDAGDGVIFSQPGMDVSSSDEITTRFVGEYKKRYGKDPDFWTAQFYEGTRLLGAAIKSGAKTGDAIREYLAQLRGFKGITGGVTFDKQGCVTHPVRFKVVTRDGFKYLSE